MNFLDRIFKRPLRPSVTTETIRKEPGPLTVHEAWGYATKEAESLDLEAKLILITSGTDIRQDGRSFSREFLFHLNSRQVRLF